MTRAKIGKIATRVTLVVVALDIVLTALTVATPEGRAAVASCSEAAVASVVERRGE